MIFSIIFSISAIAATDMKNPGYPILSILPLVISSLILYYIQRVYVVIPSKHTK